MITDLAANKRVLLIGATGTIGRATALALADAGYQTACLVRHPDRAKATLPDTVDILACDMSDTAALQRAVAAVRADVILSCLASRTGVPKDAWAVDHGLNLSLLQAGIQSGAKHFVLLSAICVQRPMLAFQHAKLAFETALQSADLTWSIVRPTAYFKSLSGQIERVRQGKAYLLFGDGRLTACKPISDRDLGRCLVRCIDDPDRHNRILPVGGPGPAITPLEAGHELFRLTGQPPRFRRVPAGFLRLVAGALGVLGWAWPSARNKAALARIGHYYATQSMLLWDAAAGRYDADATPEFGSDTLFQHYADVLAGRVSVDRGDHAVF